MIFQKKKAAKFEPIAVSQEKEPPKITIKLNGNNFITSNINQIRNNNLISQI